MRALIAGMALMFRTHLVALVWSRRALLCVLLAILPPAIGTLVPPNEGALAAVAALSGLMLLMGVAPLIGLLVGSAVVTEEVENRTITFVFTRPVPRAALFLGRWLATLAVVAPLCAASALAISQVALWERPDQALPAGLQARAALSAALTGTIYSLLAAGLGVFLKRPMIVGLGYAFAVEGLLANLPLSSQKLSLQYYLRGVLADLREPPHPGFWSELPMFQMTTFLSPAESGMRLGVLIAVALVLCTWWITRRQFLLSS